MAYYAIRARAADLIGIAITNAGMNMIPTGGPKMPTQDRWSSLRVG